METTYGFGGETRPYTSITGGVGNGVGETTYHTPIQKVVENNKRKAVINAGTAQNNVHKQMLTNAGLPTAGLAGGFNPWGGPNETFGGLDPNANWKFDYNQAHYGGNDIQSMIKQLSDQMAFAPRESLEGAGTGGVDKQFSLAKHGDLTLRYMPDGRYQLQDNRQAMESDRMPTDYYDGSGNFLGGSFENNQQSGLGKGIDSLVKIAAAAAIAGGATGAFAGTGAAGAGGAGTAAGTGAGAAGGAGAGAAASSGGFLESLAGLFGTGGTAGGAGGLSLGSLFKGGSTLASLFGAGGGGGNGGGGLGDILGLITGGVDAKRQGDAAKAMKAWLDQNKAQIDNYMKPGSPEYNQAWEAMSRKDAAAGRNSQYGPRTADFLANIAKEKADLTTRYVTGTSRGYADALNQNASKYAGLSAGLGNFLQGGNGSGGSGFNVQNITSLLDSLFGGSNASGGADLGAVWSGVDAWDDAWSNAMNGIDYGAYF